MNEFLIDELKIFLPGVVAAFAVFLYYKERDIYHYRRYATFIPRVWAAFIDTVVLWPAGIALRFVLFYLEVENQMLILMAQNLVAFLYPCYSVYLHGRYDATWGKMACRIKLLKADGEVSISLFRAFARDFIPVAFMVGIFSWIFWAESVDVVIQSPFFYAFPAIYPMWLIVELVTMYLGRRRRSFQDFFAGTVVVRSDRF